MASWKWHWVQFPCRLRQMRQLSGAGDEGKWPWPFPSSTAKPLHGQSSSCCWANHHPAGKAWQGRPPGVGTGSLPNSNRKSLPFPSHGQHGATQTLLGPCSPSCPSSLFQIHPLAFSFYLAALSHGPAEHWPNLVLLFPGSKHPILLCCWENWQTPLMARTPSPWPWVWLCDSNISLNWPAGIISPVPHLELIHIPPVVQTKCCPPEHSLLVTWSHWALPSPQSIAVKRYYRVPLFLFEKIIVCVAVWSRTGFWIVLIIILINWEVWVPFLCCSSEKTFTFLEWKVQKKREV